MRIEYVCHFKFGVTTLQTVIPDIQTAKEGFWIDGQYEYSIGDIKYWIPASAVRFVERKTIGE